MAANVIGDTNIKTGGNMMPPENSPVPNNVDSKSNVSTIFECMSTEQTDS